MCKSIFVAIVGILGTAGCGGSSQPGSSHPRGMPAPAPMASVGPVNAGSATVPDGITVHLDSSLLQSFLLDSTLFAVERQVSTCIGACIKIASEQTGPSDKWTFVAQAGDDIEIPLVHDETLPDGIYAERVEGTDLAVTSQDGVPPGFVRQGDTFAQPAGFGDRRFFKVENRQLAPLTTEEYRQALSGMTFPSDGSTSANGDPCMMVRVDSRTSCP